MLVLVVVVRYVHASVVFHGIAVGAVNPVVQFGGELLHLKAFLEGDKRLIAIAGVPLFRVTLLQQPNHQMTLQARG